mgnify:CR=1 FL=1
MQKALTPLAKKARMPYAESSFNKENTDQLNISRAQQSQRRSATLNALKPIYCTSQSLGNKPVLEGMWSTLANEMYDIL